MLRHTSRLTIEHVDPIAGKASLHWRGFDLEAVPGGWQVKFKGSLICEKAGLLAAIKAVNAMLQD